MALKATIYKAELDVSDIDRHYYRLHALTMARHPSETDERMMVRLLVFALNAGEGEGLSFGRGLSAEDEADVWRMDATGAIELWIDVGLPDEKPIRKACGRAARVIVYCYGGRAAEVWWGQCGAALERFANLSVINLPAESTQALAALARRNMRLQCSIQDGQVWLSAEDATVQIEPVPLKRAR